MLTGTLLALEKFILELTKYIMQRISKIPANIRKVTLVPTAGMLTKVGTKVPMILPMVLLAFSLPTTLPLSSKLSTENLTNEGVTVPSKNNGYTNIIIQAAKAAIVKKLVLTVNINRAEMPMIRYLPTTGIAAIHSAAIIIRL